MMVIILEILALLAAMGAGFFYPRKGKETSDKTPWHGRGPSTKASGPDGLAYATPLLMLLAPLGLWLLMPFALNMAFYTNQLLVLLPMMVVLALVMVFRAVVLDEELVSLRGHRLALAVMLGLFFMSTQVAIVSGSQALHSARYSKLMGAPVNEGIKLPRLKLDRAPLVSQSMAVQEAQKLLSQDPGLGSQVTIPRMYKQLVDGKLVWVGFLEPSSYFTWLANRTTPGYAVVSATDPADAHLVTGLKMRYLGNAGLLDDIVLHTQLARPTKTLTDFSEEIDDSGKPYWVVTVVSPSVGELGSNVAGTVLVDPVTGHTQYFSVRNTPKWVDRIQPRTLVADQVSYWGAYSHGYWNSLFAGNGVLAPSNSPELLYGDNGRAYWYVGLTSTGSDNGIVGFLLIDSRTKKAYRYNLAGANESVAQQAVEGMVRANHYYATQPVVFEVEGEPTYVMALTDATGIIRGYGLVNVRNYQVAVEAPTLQGAVQNYANALQTGSGAVNQSVKTVNATGTILRKQADVQGGSTTYYMVVTGIKPILTATSAISQLVPVLDKGDNITVVFAQGHGTTAVVQSIQLNNALH